MAHEIFRKESLDRMNSPDRLNTYIRVTSPGLWLLFGAIIVLLLSAMVWGIFGRITVSVDGFAMANKGEVYLFIPAAKASSVEEGMPIHIGEIDGEVESITSFRGTLPEISAAYGGDYKSSDITTVYQAIRAYIFNLPDGVYDASIITESVQPFSFIAN